MTPVPQNHPLRRFFAGSVEDAFYSKLGLCAPDVVTYLTDMLVTFIHVQDVYPLKGASGETLTAISEMVSRAHFTNSMSEVEQQRLVHRHVGDYTLYWLGLYPESLKQQCSKGRNDYLVSFQKQGKQSYAIAAELYDSEQSMLGHTLDRLSEHYEDCAQGLTLARHGWSDGQSLS